MEKDLVGKLKAAVGSVLIDVESRPAGDPLFENNEDGILLTFRTTDKSHLCVLVADKKVNND